MGKKSSSVVFSNCEINVEEDEIVEIKKDETIISCLSAVLKEWENTPGLTISIKRDQNYQVLPDYQVSPENPRNF